MIAPETLAPPLSAGECNDLLVCLECGRVAYRAGWAVSPASGMSACECPAGISALVLARLPKRLERLVYGPAEGGAS